MRPLILALIAALPQAGLAADAPEKPAARVEPPPSGDEIPSFPITVPKARFGFPPKVMAEMRAALVAQRDGTDVAEDAPAEDHAAPKSGH